MPIENPELFCKSLPDWGFLRGAFPRGILPSDVDGAVEVNGHFLYDEFKLTGTQDKQGQILMHKRRTLDGISKVLLLEGRTNPTQIHYARLVENGIIGPRKQKSNSDIHDFCRRWAKFVEDKPFPFMKGRQKV